MFGKQLDIGGYYIYTGPKIDSFPFGCLKNGDRVKIMVSTNNGNNLQVSYNGVLYDVKKDYLSEY
jgi:hypothetical protein